MQQTGAFLLRFFLFGFLIFSHTTQAQIDPNAFGYYQDALRYSRTITGGTARMQALGGAGTGLGGEISNAWLNPAGLGMIRRSVVTVSPAFTGASADATFRNEVTNDFRLNANFSHLGVALHLPNNFGGKYKGGTVALTFSRINDFQRQFTYEGRSDSVSIVDYFLERADGVPWAALDDELNFGVISDLGLAYATYLINPDVAFDSTSFDTYYSVVPGVPNIQSETVERRGAQNQFNISYGGNYDDVLFFGFGLGFHLVNYRETRTYTELFASNEVLREIQLTDNLRVDGGGINLSAGLLVRATDFFRIGWQVVTPTYMFLTEEYDAGMTALYNNFFFSEENVTLAREEEQTLILDGDYSLLTPFRTSLGASIFIGKHGFLTGEVEYVDYGSARLGSPSFADDLREDNNTIKALYQSVLNFKGGAEIRIDPIRIRGGVALYGDPIDDLEAQDLMIYSGGIGYMTRNFAFDLVVSYRSFDNTYSPYQFADSRFTPRAEVNNSFVNVGFTLSWFL